MNRPCFVQVIIISLIVSVAVCGSVHVPSSGRYTVSCNENKDSPPDCKVTEPSKMRSIIAIDEPNVGTMDYFDGLNKTGWDNMTLTMNESSSLSLETKYYGMGFIEGYVTFDRIYYNLNNTRALLIDDCIKNSDTINWFKKNMEWLEEYIKKDDPMAKKVGQILAQVRGMARGYEEGCKTYDCPDWMKIEEDMFFYSNFQGEMVDVLKAYQPHSEKLQQMLFDGRCSGLVKVTDDDVFVSQVGWVPFSFMTRQYKTYIFEENAFVAMASRPSMIHSFDDWYMTGHGLATMETTLIIFNSSLFEQYIKNKFDVVPAYLRVMAANYLAKNSKEWTDLFSQYNSGTYNNQWIVVDMKLFNSKSNMPDNFIRVLETVPGAVIHEDLTQLIRDKSYFPSYNFAYFPKIQKLAGMEEGIAKYGKIFDYHLYSRAKIFERDHVKVVDMKSMRAMMRYNDFKNDEYSLIPNCSGTPGGKCDPPYSAMLSISARGDLNPPGNESRYGPLPRMVGQRNHAGVDVKIANFKGMMKNGDNGFTGDVINGPTTYNGNPVFKFSTSPFKDDPNLHYAGLPDEWNFTFQQYTSRPRKMPKPIPWEGDKKKRAMIIFAAVVGFILLCVLSVASYCVICKKRSGVNGEYNPLN